MSPDGTFFNIDKTAFACSVALHFFLLEFVAAAFRAALG
jgi:hypothetical protein